MGKSMTCIQNAQEACVKSPSSLPLPHHLPWTPGLVLMPSRQLVLL